MKKSRLQYWKDLIGNVEKDSWSLAFKIVTKRLVTRRKTLGLGNFDRVKYIVRSLFPHVDWKKQRLHLLKKGNKPLEDASNYRPILCIKSMRDTKEMLKTSF